jgi:hypothetical protein
MKVHQLKTKLSEMNPDLELLCFGDPNFELNWIPGTKKFNIMSHNLGKVMEDVRYLDKKEWNELNIEEE